MKILGIVGSRRKNGNTSFLVNSALAAAKEEGVETDVLFLGDYDIADCTGCGGCDESCFCTVRDDMQKIYPLLLEADGVILGSPTYFYNVTAVVKAFIDRCYCFEMFDKDDRSVWMGLNEVLGGKYAAVIAVCEQSSEADMGYTAEGMVKPLEALGYRVVDTVKTLELYGKGDAQQTGTAVRAAAGAGRKLAKTLKLRKQVGADLSAYLSRFSDV